MLGEKAESENSDGSEGEFQGASQDNQDRVIIQIAPQGGPFSSFRTVYNSIAGLPGMTQPQRWAANLSHPFRRPAKWAVKPADFLSNHPLKIVFFIWGILFFSRTFFYWAEHQSDKDGGSLTDALVNALTDSALFQAIGVVTLLVFAYVWKKLSGPKKADHRPFLNFIAELDKIPVATAADQQLKKAITSPETPEECGASLSWHTGFISWLASGGDQSAEGERDIKGNWEAVGYILRNISKTFPFEFNDTVDVVPEMVPEAAALSAPLFQAKKRVSGTVTEATEGRDNLKSRMRELAVQSRVSEHARPRELNAVEEANVGLLANLFQDPQQTVAIEPTAAPSSQLPPQSSAPPLTDELQPGEPDIYHWPLIKDTLIDGVPNNGFFSLNDEERGAARSIDWRKVEGPKPKAEEPETPRDLSLRITSHAKAVLEHRTGQLAPEDKVKKQISIIRELLSGLLTNPLDCNRAQLVSNCLQLVCLLRPAIGDVQWKNGNYFLAHDERNTGAFKRLSVQQQAWMIYTLMSGNDAGKLLALSILQDTRLTMTSLTHFFQGYIAQFGCDPHSFSQFREQLVWLTENSSGRISELLNKDTFVGTKILWTFTADLPKDFKARGYAAPDRSPTAAAVVQAQALFWSMSDVNRQAALVVEMKRVRSNPATGTRGIPGSAQPLYALDTTGNEEAIRAGVYKTGKAVKCKKSGEEKIVFRPGSLAALRPLLTSARSENREKGYDILAMLLSDSENGLQYQRIFQAFIKEYYDEVATDRQLESFEAWLTDKDVSDIVRARFVAAMMCATGFYFEKIQEASQRAQKIYNMLQQFYPGSADLFHVFNEIAFAFRGDKKIWEDRKRCFNLVFCYRWRHNRELSDTLNELRFDCAGNDVLEDVITALNVDVYQSEDNLNRVRSYSALLSSVIERIYTDYGVLNRLKETIKDQKRLLEVRFNLTAILIYALNTTRRFDTDQQIWEVLDCFREGMGHKEPITDPRYFSAFNQFFEKFNIKKSPNAEGVLTLESVYINISFYFLRQAKLGSEVDYSRQVGWKSLSAVTMTPALHPNITLPERDMLGNILPLLVNPFGNDGMCYGNPAPAKGEDHKQLVHMALALFFNNVERINMRVYASVFREVCRLVDKNGNVVAGLQTLIQNIQNDEKVNQAFAEKIITEAIIPRMQALALYAEYRCMPSRYHFAYSQEVTRESSQAMTREAWIENMRDLLPCGKDKAKQHNTINVFFNGQGGISNSPIRQAFESLGMPDTCDLIYHMIEKDNKRIANQTAPVEVIGGKESKSQSQSQFKLWPWGRKRAADTDSLLMQAISYGTN